RSAPSGRTAETVGMRRTSRSVVGFSGMVAVVEKIKRVAKGPLLEPHDEVDHVAVGTAAKAVEAAGGRIDDERRHPVLVERAPASEATADRHEVDKAADDVGDRHLALHAGGAFMPEAVPRGWSYRHRRFRLGW